MIEFINIYALDFAWLLAKIGVIIGVVMLSVAY
jgi:hypothetical protein